MMFTAAKLMIHMVTYKLYSKNIFLIKCNFYSTTQLAMLHSFSYGVNKKKNKIPMEGDPPVYKVQSH